MRMKILRKMFCNDRSRQLRKDMHLFSREGINSDKKFKWAYSYQAHLKLFGCLHFVAMKPFLWNLAYSGNQVAFRISIAVSRKP